jgi:hypothetical protein
MEDTFLHLNHAPAQEQTQSEHIGYTDQERCHLKVAEAYLSYATMGEEPRIAIGVGSEHLFAKEPEVHMMGPGR